VVAGPPSGWPYRAGPGGVGTQGKAVRFCFCGTAYRQAGLQIHYGHRYPAVGGRLRPLRLLLTEAVPKCQILELQSMETAVLQPVGRENRKGPVTK
jgi:hypothetical protein